MLGCRDDIVGMILEAVSNPKWAGVYNAVAPNPVRMGEFCSALGGAMGRPSFFPVPDFALQALLGEGAQVRSRAGSGEGALLSRCSVREVTSVWLGGGGGGRSAGTRAPEASAQRSRLPAPAPKVQQCGPR
jgi:hypothetical protein